MSIMLTDYRLACIDYRSSCTKIELGHIFTFVVPKKISNVFCGWVSAVWSNLCHIIGFYLFLFIFTKPQ